MAPKNYRKINNKMVQCCLDCMHGIHLHQRGHGCSECGCSHEFPYCESYKKYVIEELLATKTQNGSTKT